MTFTYAYGYKTRIAAELAIIDELESSMISRCENPKVGTYRNSDGALRYRILLNAA